MMKGTSMLAAVILGMMVAGSISATAQCESAIKKVRDTWIENWNGKNLDKVMELYTSDAVYLSPDGDRVAGRDNIRAAFQKTMDMNATDKVDTNETHCSGSMASDMGTYTETVGGKTNEGAYIVVLRKVSGKWLLYGHSSNRKMAGQTPQ